MLQNKKIVIIGGTTGLGLSAAHSFIKHGAKVIVVGRNVRSARLAQEKLGTSGFAIVGDAIGEQTAAKAIVVCQKKYGGFDGLYHVAGGSGRSFGDGPLHEMTLEGWNKTLELNLTSVMLSNRAAIKTFIGQNIAGCILNMGSVLGFSPAPGYFTTHAYAAAKSAIIGYSKSIAAFYAKYNIRVNVIAPALVATSMSERASKDSVILDYIKTKQPLDGGRIGRPGDLDGMATLLMSDQASMITGQVISVDGGWSVSEGQL